MASKPKTLPGCSCALSANLDAVKKSDRNKINLDGLSVVASCNVDACFRTAEPHANRWDYYLDVGRKGELYFEVHEVSHDEVPCLLLKADWLRGKIAALQWPETEGRPLFVAPTKGISPFALYGVLSRLLALHKITVIMKGDKVSGHL